MVTVKLSLKLRISDILTGVTKKSPAKEKGRQPKKDQKTKIKQLEEKKKKKQIEKKRVNEFAQRSEKSKGGGHESR